MKEEILQYCKNNKKLLISASILIFCLILGNLSRERVNIIKQEIVKEGKKDLDNIQIKHTFYDLKLEQASKEDKADMLFYTDIPGDISYGNPNAPVKIIIFSSYSCHYCQKFENEVFPKLKENFIDKNLVYFVYRTISNKTNLFLATSLRCLTNDESKYKLHTEYFNYTNHTFKTLEEYILANVKKYNNDVEYLEQCYLNQELFEQTVYFQKRNEKAFNIRGNPVFIINEESIQGYTSYSSFEKIINNILEKTEKKEKPENTQTTIKPEGAK